METLYLAFNVKGQLLTRTDSYPVYSGSQNFVGAKFIFDWHWNNTNRYAQFVVGENTYTKDIINGVCSVPWECFENAGTFTVTIFGGTLITANAVTVTVLQSAIQPDQLPNEPTAGYFDEVVTMVNEAKADTIFAAGGAEADRILAEDAKNEARKWVDGTGATEDDPQFDNHSKYHAEESKAWAIGTADTEKEQHNNSAKDHAMAAKTSEDNAKISETNAGGSATTASRALTDTLGVIGTSIAPLVGGKVPLIYMESEALYDLFSVADESELVGLPAHKGDVAHLVGDVDNEPTIIKSWQLLANPATERSNWVVCGTSYAVRAGNATLADHAADSERVNGSRHVDMTDEQYAIAESAGTIVLTDFYYTYSE